MQIAIDGPSGAGKSTLAKALAREFRFLYVDTGAMYRAVGLYMRNRGIDPLDRPAVLDALPEVSVELKYEEDGQHILLCGEDVSRQIRENEISRYASDVSKIPEVRTFLTEKQKRIAETCDVVMDGRDIGTVVLPSAELKIFLSASPETRARRRAEELAEKGQTVSVEQVLEEMRQRDEADRTRDIAPAIPAEDAIPVDNSRMSVPETVCLIRGILIGKGLLKP